MITQVFFLVLIQEKRWLWKLFWYNLDV